MDDVQKDAQRWRRLPTWGWLVVVLIVFRVALELHAVALLRAMNGTDDIWKSAALVGSWTLLFWGADIWARKVHRMRKPDEETRTQTV